MGVAIRGELCATLGLYGGSAPRYSKLPKNMESVVSSDPVTLSQRLQLDGGPLQLEALQRIRFLENLCGMMTDTGVILEEDAAELSKPDFWSPENYSFYSNPWDAVQAVTTEALEIAELQRWHQLENSWGVIFPCLVDSKGREISNGRVEEFASYGEAEEAVAAYLLMRRRTESGI